MKTAVVTGASAGIGLETARGLAARAFHVVLLCRNAEKAKVAHRHIEGCVPGASTDIVLADLSVLADVRRAATEITQRLDGLDVLVNNAGITLRKPAYTVEGIDVMEATNHLGPFLLTNLLRPMLEASAPSRVVTVASAVHRIGKLRLDELEETRNYGFLGFPRYGETKLMNILFTRELARRLEGTGVVANAVHPGAVRTDLGAPPGAVRALTGRFMRSPEQGARTSIHAATAPDLATVTGRYFIDEKPADDKLSAQARDDRLAAELWERSAQLVGLTTG